MNRVMATLMRGGSRLAVALYKRSGGRIGGRGAGGLPVALLTVRGRRSGQPRTTPVGIFEHQGGYLVVGSAGGAPHDPQWFKNLRSASSAQLQIRDRTVSATVHELRGEERDTAWREVVLVQCPPFAKYETKTTRKMPIARLTPIT